jgi:hypothetical protein
MNDTLWKTFFSICRQELGIGSWDSWLSQSWCAFTTFSSLQNGARYWNCGFPDIRDIQSDHLQDGGLWRQSFYYSDIAHIIVPANFYSERVSGGSYEGEIRSQDLQSLASKLEQHSVPFRVTSLVLEIKVF